MGWVLLVLVTVASTAIWFIIRHTLAGNGSVLSMSFWASLTACIFMAIIILADYDCFFVPKIWGFGIVFGLAFSIGFCLCIMRCVTIGPVGPTATINNMSMLCGIFYSVIFLQHRAPNLWMIIGLIGICASIILVCSKSQDKELAHSHNFSGKWLMLVMIGGAGAGVSFVLQTHMGDFYAQHSYLFLFSGYLSSCLVLLILILRNGEKFIRGREKTGGIIIGILFTFMAPATLYSIKMLGLEVTLPVTVGMPTIIVLILAHFFYREHLSKLIWTACMIGIFSLFLLIYGKILISNDVEKNAVRSAFSTYIHNQANENSYPPKGDTAVLTSYFLN